MRIESILSLSNSHVRTMMWKHNFVKDYLAQFRENCDSVLKQRLSDTNLISQC